MTLEEMEKEIEKIRLDLELSKQQLKEGIKQMEQGVNNAKETVDYLKLVIYELTPQDIQGLDAEIHSIRDRLTALENG